MKNRFIGDTRIPSFNDENFTIDLTNYSETVMPEFTGFKFQYITILDVSQYTVLCKFYKELEQCALRFYDGEEEDLETPEVNLFTDNEYKHY